MKTQIQTPPESIESIEELREFVEDRLCQQNDFEIGVFPLSERLLFRAGLPCGIFFCLHGPRSVQLNAIWETDSNTLLFYGSSGQKVEKIVLQYPIDLEQYDLELQAQA